ncbi:MAG TPA: AAA family ATPase [Streptosporangiaceae bacterium]|nr:AAA family ATPase [Streptosporangiaceae bacterium]
MTAALIGRDHPAAVLRAEIDRLAASHGGLVLVTGEAGIGKTALVTRAMTDARRLGALVLSGSCWDSESAPGYWPWVQVIRALRRAATAEEWAAAAAGGGLSVLLGEAPSTDTADGFQLYDAVTTALVSVSHRVPVVVVLEDLHWADTASLKLLEFAAQHTWFERLLLVGTYRDVEVEAADGHPLRPLLTPLLAKATTVTLTGLGRAEVGRLIERTAGREPTDDMVAEVHRRTGGNPFFVEQTARLWHSGGAVTAIAPGVRDALRRRLSLLPEPVVRLLSTAAVLGREFHRQMLAATAAVPVPHVARLLDQAVTARLVVTLGGGSFAFAHDLVRETLYDLLDEAAARERHAAVIRALDSNPTLAERILPADLARHAYLAGDDIEPARAVGLLLAAARDANSRMAFEESIAHHRRAYERAAGEPRRRVAIAIDLASGLHHNHETDEAWRICTEAVSAVKEMDDPVLLARVALGLYEIDHAGERHELVTELLRAAHGRLVDAGGAAPDHGMSPGRLAQELTLHTAALARSGADDEALGFSLWARHNTIWGPGTAEERLALTDELTALARRTGNIETEVIAASFKWVALLEQGDPRYLDQHHEFVALAESKGMPLPSFASSIDQCIITTLLGRFAEAQSFMERAIDSVEPVYSHFAYMADHLRWSLWMLQGRFDELADLHRVLAEHDHPYPHLMVGITAVEMGDIDAALRHLAETEAATGGSESLARSFVPMSLRFQAQVAAATRDPERCARARSALAPFTREWAVSVYGCDISGPFVLWSALLDAAEGRWDDAIGGFTAAYTSADRLLARPWSIEARGHLARALLARGAAGDARAGAALLDEVEREAAEIGMRHVVERVRRTRAEHRTEWAESGPGSGPGSRAEPAAGGADDGLAAGERPDSPRFRFDGEVWSLGFAGRTVHLPDAKGLRDLHLLLSRPGADIPAVRLVDPAAGEAVVAARRLGGDAVLDAEAKARYKRRLEQLDEEIDRAAERGDDARAAEYDRERAALLDELKAAAGLAGRDRRLGDEAERARKTVTARIRDTLRKLDRRHPELAAYLRATVTTGATCRYQPDEALTWRL